MDMIRARLAYDEACAGALNWLSEQVRTRREAAGLPVEPPPGEKLTFSLAQPKRTYRI